MKGQRFTLFFVGLVSIVGGKTCSARGMSDYELRDWKNTETSTTLELSDQCGILLEARLLDLHLSNYLMLGLKNRAHASQYIKSSEFAFTFSSGRERAASIVDMNEVTKLEENVEKVIYIKLPEKGDFKDSDSLQVNAPVFDSELKVKTCALNVKFYRNAQVPHSKMSENPYTAFDFNLGLGSSFYRGHLSNVGGEGYFMDLGVDSFFNVRDGVFADLVLDGISSPQYALLSQVSGTTVDSSSSVMGMGIFVGYVQRHILSNRLALSWKLGPGMYALRYSNADTSNSFAGMGQVALDYRFGQVSRELLPRVFSVGIAVSDIWIPRGDINDQVNYSGHDASWMIRLKMGI